MNKLIQNRYLIRENLGVLIGVCLCLYFSYHIIQGERSFMRLFSLSDAIATESQINNNLEGERQALQKKVTMMRPGSINKDLLEEQARLVLGYTRTDEIVILSN